MPGVELDKAVIDKHAIPWYDHNLDRDKIVLKSDGRTEGLRETFSVIELYYLQEKEMLKAVMEVFKEEEEDERKTWLIPLSQIKAMSKKGENPEF